jgi:hypothetical protein
VVCRLYFGKKRPVILVPLPVEDARPHVGESKVSTPQPGWTSVTLNSTKDLDELGDLLRKAYDYLKASKSKSAEIGDKPDTPTHSEPLGPDPESLKFR